MCVDTLQPPQGTTSPRTKGKAPWLPMAARTRGIALRPRMAAGQGTCLLSPGRQEVGGGVVKTSPPTASLRSLFIFPFLLLPPSNLALPPLLPSPHVSPLPPLLSKVQGSTNQAFQVTAGDFLLGVLFATDLRLCLTDLVLVQVFQALLGFLQKASPV